MATKSPGGTARPLRETLVRRTFYNTNADGSFAKVQLSPMSATFHSGAPTSPASAGPVSPSGSAVQLAPLPDEEALLTNCKVWVKLRGAEGKEQKLRAEKNICVTDLRKAMKIKVGVPVNELHLSVDGKPLMEGVAQPFRDCDAKDELIVHWERVDRLKNLMGMRGLATINSRGKFDRSLLHFAVLDGEIDLCKRTVDHKERLPEMLNLRDVFHDTPLMYASILGYLEIVELLLDRQATPSCQNLCGRTSLQMAAEHGHKRVVKALLQEDANLGKGPRRLGPMGAVNQSRSAPYLAELNERHQATHKIKIFKMSKGVQPGLDF